MTYHSIDATPDEGLLLLQPNRPEVCKALDECTQAVKDR